LLPTGIALDGELWYGRGGGRRGEGEERRGE
jgi:hypothetical protein